MDSSLVWLGYALTLAFGLWGVYATLRHRYAGRITFVKIEEIWLFDDIVRNLPELEVLYRDRPVSERLVLLTGALVNSGWKDITESLVAAPLELVLPDRMQWKYVKIISRSEHVHGKASVGDGKKIIFETGMFRRNEFIQFQALLQIDTDQDESDQSEPDIFKSIACTHRIADTAPVRKTELFQESKRVRFHRLYGLPAVAIVALLLGAATYVVDHYLPEMVFAYDLDVGGDVVSVSATPQEDNTVDVSGVREEYEAELALAEFLDNVRGDPTLTKNTSRFQGVGYFMVIYPALVLLFVGFLHLEVRRDRALRRIIGVDS